MTEKAIPGKLPPASILVDISKLVDLYYSAKIDPNDMNQKVSFGTSGHRGSSYKNSFNEPHILAITQAICEFRKTSNINGPLYLGKDTHALSEPALKTAIEVFAANGIEIFIQENNGYTPTPVISHAILTYNRGRKNGLADGVIITPSHNPPQDGGIKYNPPTGGPADTVITKSIEERANQILLNKNKDVKRIAYTEALKGRAAHLHDYITPYVDDLANIIDIEAIRNSGIKIGADPLGGAGVAFWQPIVDKYKLNIEIVNKKVDETFCFMTVDLDGKIRMDCSSPWAMASLVALKDKYDIAFGNDPDFDRHGIVTPTVGLMNPNHFLAVSIWYLFQNRTAWRKDSKVGKTLVSSSMIDRVAKSLGREIYEVPVGFKWFVDGLLSGEFGFAGEESAGASFLRKDGTVWTTDKDGIIMDLLAAEITAVTGKDPGKHYLDLTQKFGAPIYKRIDVDTTLKEAEKISRLLPEQIKAGELAGERIKSKINHAPGNNAKIGGIKISTENGWAAVRPSGTEPKYKIYAESFLGAEHLERLISEIKNIIAEDLHK